MPRAPMICVAKGCISKTIRDGRCREHQTRKPWQNTSARNQSRPANWPTIKAQVLARDRFTCQMCGARSNLEVDHIIPVAKGGSWEMENLWVLCKEDHIRKTRKFG
ncbi:HNH endonuclease [Streptomyces phage Ibantik]|uniref:HNH endonuclease n=1 Tax=Streptomyces phage Ibantik TaxID=2182397 RepID=A0A2U8UP84_9CAUD|nr:HNH endonuclease [Streptomyces phage Ibantik]AWN05281.1 HNH endonuclease [Streptomyces phage Ibantik]